MFVINIVDVILVLYLKGKAIPLQALTGPEVPGG
jgi:hypothetical protein